MKPAQIVHVKLKRPPKDALEAARIALAALNKCPANVPPLS